MEKTIEQRRLEFLEDTVKFYSEDVSRRAKDGDMCCYRTADGRACAIGRHISDDKTARDLGSAIVFSRRVFDALPKEIQELGQGFLSAVQDLHDGDIFWQEGGLSEKGDEYVEKIKSEYKLIE